MFFIGQNLKYVHMTYSFLSFWSSFDFNSRYLVFEVSEAVVQRSSLPEVFCTKGADLRPATLLKKRLWHRFFCYGLCEIFKITFFYRTPTVAASEVYFSSHQRNIVCEYKLHGKPIMKYQSWTCFWYWCWKNLFFNVKLKLPRNKC